MYLQKYVYCCNLVIITLFLLKVTFTMTTSIIITIFFLHDIYFFYQQICELNGDSLIINLFTFDTGVKQGDYLRPSLFSYFINDLHYASIFDDNFSPTMLENILQLGVYLANDLVILTETHTIISSCKKVDLCS